MLHYSKICWSLLFVQLLVSVWVRFKHVHCVLLCVYRSEPSGAISTFLSAHLSPSHTFYLRVSLFLFFLLHFSISPSLDLVKLYFCLSFVSFFHFCGQHDVSGNNIVRTHNTSGQPFIYSEQSVCVSLSFGSRCVRARVRKWQMIDGARWNKQLDMRGAAFHLKRVVAQCIGGAILSL